MIVFRNARIIDGTGAELDRGYVVVEDNRIEKVGKGSGPVKKRGDGSVDLEGRTLLPGIIDAHVHLCIDGSADPLRSIQKDSLAMITLKAARHAHLSLLAGVTTVRDMGSHNGVSGALRDATQLGVMAGPRIVSSNQAVCITGGQGWPFSREADGEDEVRKAVREQIRAGADAVKMMATGGVITPGIEAGAPQFTFEELKAGAEEAHKAGRKIAAHAQGNEGIKNALRAGFDTIEHGISIDDEAIGLFLERKALLVPTLSAPFNIMEKGEKSGIPPYIIEKTRKVKDAHIESVKKAYQAGIPIASGADSGTPFNAHGDNLRELELLVGLGLSPMEAIVSATRVASEAVGMGNRIGTVQPGKMADLIVVEGDPLKGISLLKEKEKIVLVMKDGRFFKRSI
ncbi:MAG: amidohydrolase family protein [Thermodesulfobacteriota bacterium]